VVPAITTENMERPYRREPQPPSPTGQDTPVPPRPQ